MSTFSKRKEVKEKIQHMGRLVDLDELLLDQHDRKIQRLPEDQVMITLPPSHFYVERQVRQEIDPYEIEQRAASMRTNGQLQAIVVYPMETEGKNKGKYKIDKGECRWRAAQLIEGFKLKALVDPEAPQRNRRKRIVGQIVENDQRADLRPLEMAQALEELLSTGMTQEEVAIELGWITRAKKPNINKVSRTLSIMKLPDEGKKLIADHIVKDLIALEFLRKISEINLTKFSLLCDLAREDKGLSRKRAEQEYKQCQANEKQEQGGKIAFDTVQNITTPTKNETEVTIKSKNGSSANEFSHERIEHSASGYDTQSQNEIIESEHKRSKKTKVSSSATTQNIHPVIHVEWRGMQTGVLVFDKNPEDEGFIWIRTDKTSDLISAELKDLRIKAVSL